MLCPSSNLIKLYALTISKLKWHLLIANEIFYRILNDKKKKKKKKKMNIGPKQLDTQIEHFKCNGYIFKG